MIRSTGSHQKASECRAAAEMSDRLQVWTRCCSMFRMFVPDYVDASVKPPDGGKRAAEAHFCWIARVEDTSKSFHGSSSFIIFRLIFAAALDQN